VFIFDVDPILNISELNLATDKEVIKSQVALLNDAPTKFQLLPPSIE
jgi:hypothetical protein